MGTNFRTQVWLLLKKNFILKKRNGKALLGELLYPVYFTAILVILVLTQKPIDIPGVSHTRVEDLQSLSSLCNERKNIECQVWYIPSPLMNDTIVQLANVRLSFNGSFESPNEMSSRYKENNKWALENVIACLWYEGTTLHVASPADSAQSPKPSSEITAIVYAESLKQFGITQLIDQRAFVVPKSQFLVFDASFVYLFPIYFSFTFLYGLQQVITIVVTEREKHLLDSLRISGMRDSAYIASWFITQIVMALVGILTMAVALYLSKVINYTSLPLMLVIFLLYNCSLIAQGFLLSTMVKKAKNGVGLVTLALILGLGLAFLGHFFYFEMPVPTILASLINTVPFCQLMFQMASAESTKVPLSLDFNTPGHFYSPALAFIMLIIDTILYAFAAWLVNQFTTGRLRCCCWRGSPLSTSRTVRVNADSKPLLTRSAASGDWEQDAIVVENLRMDYSKDVVALDGVDLAITPGITGLVGQNGAGKSSLLRILAGLQLPSSGSCTVGGLAVPLQMDLVRARGLGVCPQEDALYEELNVREHLELFARLKGVHSDAVVLKAMSDVQLTPGDAEQLAKSLSGGQKRKLSLAIALLADPSVLILDEPTSGLDSTSSAAMWARLSNLAEGTIVLVTTHNMAESDYCDQIIMLKKGRMCASGSPKELKRQWGLGYELRFQLVEEGNNEDLVSLIEQTIPAEMVTILDSFSAIMFDFDASPQIPSLLRNLEENAGSFNISTYTLTTSSLQEVFLRVIAE